MSIHFTVPFMLNFMRETLIKYCGADQALWGISSYVLSNEDFQKCRGSLGKHHDYEGGLVAHTFEVFQNCISICNGSIKQDIDIAALLTAAIYHDFGKIYEYPIESEPDAEYKQRIYHIAGSHAEFVSNSRYHVKSSAYDPRMRKIQHCILAHHGHKNWNSIHEPFGEEATILHAADMLSAYAGALRIKL